MNDEEYGAGVKRILSQLDTIQQVQILARGMWSSDMPYEMRIAVAEFYADRLGVTDEDIDKTLQGSEDWMPSTYIELIERAAKSKR